MVKRGMYFDGLNVFYIEFDPAGHLSPGQNNLSALFSNIPSFALHTHPFDRWVSTRCEVLHSDADKSVSR